MNNHIAVQFLYNYKYTLYPPERFPVHFHVERGTDRRKTSPKNRKNHQSRDKSRPHPHAPFPLRRLSLVSSSP
jgi:hypothetical protein